MECAACAADLDHCHGTLVIHPDDGFECTGEGCAGDDRLRHSLVVDCFALGCGCTADVVLRRAS